MLSTNILFYGWPTTMTNSWMYHWLHLHCEPTWAQQLCAKSSKKKTFYFFQRALINHDKAPTLSIQSYLTFRMSTEKKMFCSRSRTELIVCSICICICYVNIADIIIIFRVEYLDSCFYSSMLRMLEFGELMDISRHKLDPCIDSWHQYQQI